MRLDVNQKPLKPKEMQAEIIKRNLIRDAVINTATCVEHCHLGFYGSLQACPYTACQYYDGRLDGLMFDN